jgi:cardiolipin synthase
VSALPGGGVAAEGHAQRLDLEEAGLGRVLTVPNVLSAGRLGLLGVFVWVLFDEHQRVVAFLLLALAGITDFVDGWVARRFHQVSTLGKVLDPTADRVVVATAAISTAVYGAVPGWLAGAVLGREFLISAAVLALAAAGAGRIDVLWLGKAGTFGLMGCFPLFLLSDGAGTFAQALRYVTWVLLVPALALSLAATLAYVPAARRALAERRSRASTARREAMGT